MPICPPPVPPTDTMAGAYHGTPSPMPMRPAPSPLSFTPTAPPAKGGAQASVAQRSALPVPPPSAVPQDPGDIEFRAGQLGLLGGVVPGGPRGRLQGHPELLREDQLPPTAGGVHPPIGQAVLEAYLQERTSNIAKDLAMLLNRVGSLEMLNVRRTKRAKMYQLCTDPSGPLDVAFPPHSRRWSWLTSSKIPRPS